MRPSSIRRLPVVQEHAYALTVFEAFDAYAAACVAKAHEEGHTIPCGEGCAACCYDIAGTTQVEVGPILERLRLLPRAERDAVHARALAWAARLRAHGIDPAADRPEIRAYHRARVACPLLDVRGRRCMVYEVRPLSCRGHYVMDEPASVCANRAKEPVVNVLNLDEQVLRSAREMLNRFGAEAGIQPGATYPVATALLPWLLLALWRYVEDPSLDFRDFALEPRGWQ